MITQQKSARGGKKRGVRGEGGPQRGRREQEHGGWGAGRAGGRRGHSGRYGAQLEGFGERRQWGGDGGWGTGSYQHNPRPAYFCEPTIASAFYAAPLGRHTTSSVHHNTTSFNHTAPSVHHTTPSVNLTAPSVHHNTPSVHHNTPLVHHNTSSVHHNTTSVHHNTTSVHHNTSWAAPWVHHTRPWISPQDTERFCPSSRGDPGRGIKGGPVRGRNEKPGRRGKVASAGGLGEGQSLLEGWWFGGGGPEAGGQ